MAREEETSAQSEAFGLSRRVFMTSAGVVAAAAPLQSLAASSTGAEGEFDIIVVGSGCAGLSAAVAAVDHGASVLILEKGPVVGGQTQKSHGVCWIPNNEFMRSRGMVDSRDDALRYMARLSYPERYNPSHETLGMSPQVFSLMEVFYDQASQIAQIMRKSGAWQQKMAISRTGRIACDYFAHIPENKSILGRPVETDPGDGRRGFGGDMVFQLHSYVKDRGARTLVNQRVTRILREPDGRVSGVVSRTEDGKETAFRARKAVIFGSGGFSMNEDLCAEYLRGPILGTSAVPQNEGDLIPMAIETGARLGAMNEAWHTQVILEEALQTRATPNPVFILSCDSMVTVNKYGKRMYDEKFVFNERTRSHHDWDVVRGEFPNLYQFFIYDQRAADIKGQTIPPNVANFPYLIIGATLDELAKNIERRLDELRDAIGDFALHSSFLANLKDTVASFNQYARDGADPEFQRGEAPIDEHYNPPHPTNNYPNRFMYPISDKGPYYCVIVAPGAVDTKGGPVINENAQVMDTRDRPIPGFYAAGNCAASPSGQAFWSAGATLSLAMTFGYIAGRHASKG